MLFTLPDRLCWVLARNRKDTRKFYKRPGPIIGILASSLLLPLEQIRPGEFISQYLDWLYFTLTLVFFLAVAGVLIDWGLEHGPLTWHFLFCSWFLSTRLFASAAGMAQMQFSGSKKILASGRLLNPRSGTNSIQNKKKRGS
ncbi:MAG TPA: hypothetical protein ENN79_03515 [Desulfobacteraceae bacterium]|nr:hypothetical protein [Desulfobacteraceae bacterium]